jgi:arsenite methyltransferase
MPAQTKTEIPEDIREVVRERYGRLAEEHKAGTQADCGCATEQSSCCAPESEAQFDTVVKLYEDADLFELPSEITEFSLGCGDPITLASLKEGQTVLDLGSGGGLDCFLAAKKVGPAGQVIGVDMTASMIEKARANKEKLGAENVEFRLGEIEHLPVSDGSVDVIISNCVINLSPDKPQVFRDAFRALKPGGKIAVSDIVTDGPLPDEIKNSLSAWAGCIAGAMDVKDYVMAIRDAGFTDVDVQAEYWDQVMIDTAIDQLDSEIKSQIEEAGGNGQAVMIINEDSDKEVIVVEDVEAIQDFDPQKAIFSAKITAQKPE